MYYFSIFFLTIILVYQIYRLIRSIRRYKQTDKDTLSQFFYFFKNALRVLIIIILIYFSINLVERLYVDIQYNKPLKVINQLIRDAIDDKEYSAVILSSEEWEQHKPNSIFRVTREEVQWEKIKHIIQSEKIHLLNVNRKGEIQFNGTYNYKIKVIKEKYRNVSIYYNPVNTDKYPSINFSLEIVDGKWRVIGSKFFNED